MTTERWRPLREDEILLRLADLVRRQESGVLATVIGAERSTPRQAGSKMIVHADGCTTGTIGGGAAEARVIAEAKEVLSEGVCRRLDLDLVSEEGVCGGAMEVFLEPIVRTTPFVVVGAGHVGRALVEVGRTLPLHFVLVDDRPEFIADLAVAPGLNGLVAGPDAWDQAPPPQRRTGVLVASRNHELDTAYLDALLSAERKAGQTYAFVGVLGSRRKISRIRADLAERGHAPRRLADLQAPVGLDIRAETPAEIAVSVLAEALAVLRDVSPLTDEQGQPLGLRLQRRRA